MGLNITLMSYAEQVIFGFTANASALPDAGRLAQYTSAACGARLVDNGLRECPMYRSRLIGGYARASQHSAPAQLLASLALALAAFAASAASFDRQMFEEFVTMRAGDGADAVYWHCTGEMRSFPGGDVIAHVEGLGTDRLVRDERDANVAYQLHRELFFYRDAATGGILRDADGKLRTPIVMPYQFTTFRLAGNDLQVFVEQGSGPRLMRIGPVAILPRHARGGNVYSMPLFVQREGAAFASYDYFVDASGNHRVSWIRFDDWVRPPATTRRVTHAVCVREHRFDDLPAGLRDYIEKEAPAFREPPRDIEEIRRLQRGGGASSRARGETGDAARETAAEPGFRSDQHVFP